LHLKLKHIEKFTIPEYYYDIEYHGAYYFMPESITVFNPVSNGEINKYFNCKIKFGPNKI